MRKLLSTNYSAGAFNAAMLLFRLTFGVLMMNHGYGKLTHFSEMADKMPHFLGMSSTVTAALLVFAEFFCGMFIILGLFTRLACVPLIIAMGYALFLSHKGDIFGQGEMATLYLGAFVVLLFLGPGKVSVDGLTGK